MNFRRVLTVLAVLALFAGLASAQITNPNPVNCTVSAATNPSIRTEGVAERVGDVMITCTGGNVPGAGSVGDRVNITVNYGVVVTSPNADPMTPVLFIDEPASMTNATATALGITGYGPHAPIGTSIAASICTTANQAATWIPTALAGVYASGANCAAYANAVSGLIVGTTTSAGGTNMMNVYQGAVGILTSNNTQVTFSNVPFIATGAANVSRIYRIHNVRVTPGSSSAITANVTVTSVAGSAQTMSIASGNGATVATPTASLTTSLSQVTTGASLCASAALVPSSGQSKANVTLLSFKAGYGNAFKTRNLPATTNAAGTAFVATLGDAEAPAAFVAQAPPVQQGWSHEQSSVNGSVKLGTTTLSTANSESGVIFTDGAAATYGISASVVGTRFKATFKSLPSNVTYYVSITNVTDFQTNATAPGTGAGDSTATPWAVLTGSETGAYAPTATFACTPTTASCGNGVVALAALAPVAGAASVIWEVTNNNPASAPTFNFAVFAVYNIGTPPATGNGATVTLGYADANGSGTTTPVGVTTTVMPRFASQTTSTNSALAFYPIVACQTALLFPYVTNAGGYETGIAISNTSMDPFGTVQGSGTCNMYFYGPNQPANAIALASTTGSTAIAAGGQIANTLTNVMGQTGFSGYAIAVCNFQFAHGFAFVQTSKQTLGMGYLPLVMQTGVGLNTRGQALVGESLTH